MVQPTPSRLSSTTQPRQAGQERLRIIRRLGTGPMLESSGNAQRLTLEGGQTLVSGPFPFYKATKRILKETRLTIQL